MEGLSDGGVPPLSLTAAAMQDAAVPEGSANVVEGASAAALVVAVGQLPRGLPTTVGQQRRSLLSNVLREILLRLPRRVAPVAQAPMSLDSFPLLDEILGVDDEMLDFNTEGGSPMQEQALQEFAAAVGPDVSSLPEEMQDLVRRGARSKARDNNAVAEVRGQSKLARPAVPRFFTGKTKHVKVQVWLRNVFQYLTLCKIPVEEWVGYAETYLDDEAANVWFSAQNRDPALRVWASFHTVLMSHFADVNASQTARDQMDGLLCGSPANREAVQLLIRTFIGLVALVIHTDASGILSTMDIGTQCHMVLSKITAAGHDGALLASHVRAKGPYDDLTALAAVAVAHAENVSAGPSGRGRNRDSDYQVAGPRGGAKSGGGNRSAGRGGASGSGGGGSGGGGGGSGSGGVRPGFKDISLVPQDLQDRRMKAQMCKWCGKAGHVWVKCEQKQPTLGQ